MVNHPQDGLLNFAFEGTVLTDAEDVRCKSCELEIHLQGETCDWLTQPVVAWFEETVRRAVAREFDLYIQAGDLQRAKERMERIQQECDDQGGFMGMYL